MKERDYREERKVSFALLPVALLIIFVAVITFGCVYALLF